MKSWPIVLVAAAVALAGCAHHKNRLSNRNAPDEFAISRNAPRALADDAQQNAAEALFGPGVRITPKSPAESNLLDKAGAAKPEPNIRSSAADPDTPTVNKGAFLRELLAAPPKTLDAKKAEVTLGG